MPVNQPMLLAVATIISTSAGGLIALRARRHMRRVLAFTTGVVLGVVSFDLLPEVFKLVAVYRVPLVTPMITLVVGFLLFRSLEELMLSVARPVSELASVPTLPGDVGNLEDGHPYAGLLSAAALVGHSAFDGVSIGIAFQVSPGTGLAVAVAVIAHDFADGINTVGVMLAHGNTVRNASWLLAIDAIAPLIGAASTLFLRLPPATLTIYLGFFAGFLLHVATSASHAVARGRPSRSVLGLLALNWLGAAVAFVVTRGAW